MASSEYVTPGTSGSSQADANEEQASAAAAAAAAASADLFQSKQSASSSSSNRTGRGAIRYKETTRRMVSPGSSSCRSMASSTGGGLPPFQPQFRHKAQQVYYPSFQSFQQAQAQMQATTSVQQTQNNISRRACQDAMGKLVHGNADLEAEILVVRDQLLLIDVTGEMFKDVMESLLTSCEHYRQYISTTDTPAAAPGNIRAFVEYVVKYYTSMTKETTAEADELIQKYTEYQKNLSDTTTTLEGSEKEYRDKAIVMEEDITSTQRRANADRAERDRIIDELGGKVQNEAYRPKRSLAGLQKEIDDLKRAIEDAKYRSNRASKEADEFVQSLRQRLTTIQERIDQLRGSGNLKDAMEQCKKDIHEVKQAMQEIVRERKDTVTLVENASQKYLREGSQEQFPCKNTIIREFEVLNRELVNLNNNLTRQEKENVELKRRLTGKDDEDERKNMKSEIEAECISYSDKLKGDMKTAANLIVTLKDRIADAKRENAERTKDYDKELVDYERVLEETKVEYDKNKEQWEKVRKVFEEQIAAIRNELEDYYQRSHQMKNQVLDNNTMLKEKDVVLMALSADIDTKMGDYKNSKDGLMAEINRLRKRIAELESLNAKAEKELNNKIQKIGEELDTANEAKLNLDARCKDENKECDRIDREIGGLKKVIEDLSPEVDKQRVKLEQLWFDKEKLAREGAAQQCQLDKASVSKADFKKRLEDLKEDIKQVKKRESPENVSPLLEAEVTQLRREIENDKARVFALREQLEKIKGQEGTTQGALIAKQREGEKIEDEVRRFQDQVRDQKSTNIRLEADLEKQLSKLNETSPMPNRDPIQAKLDAIESQLKKAYPNIPAVARQYQHRQQLVGRGVQQNARITRQVQEEEARGSDAAGSSATPKGRKQQSEE